MHQLISHHLLLCVNTKKSLCCNNLQSLKSWEKLKKVLKEMNLEDPKREEGIILRSKVDCLRICSEGPILLIWPEGVWYKNVSPERIEIIVKRHLLKGVPIKEWILKETPLRVKTCLES